ITIRLAAEIAARLPEPLPFSFCAGVTAMNSTECIEAGLGPLTVATDLLKPGGYLRLEHIAENAVIGLAGKPSPHPDAKALAALAAKALERREYRADWKEGNSVIRKELPLFDCFAAPCIDACPTHQNVPGYIRAIAEGDTKGALEIVLADNPLPTITGLVCDHACTKVCCRDDYEGAVDIRGMKLACARSAEIPPERREPRTGVGKTAIFGSGPAGLSCAHYLALDGYPVTVFEKARETGGVVSSTIPKFRIAREDIERDVNRIKQLGAEFRLGFPDDLDIGKLRNDGFTSFVVASGAPIGRTMNLDGNGVDVVGALEFLVDAAQDGSRYAKYRNIVVIGGGFTSLDAVRVSARFAHKPNVRLVYRRTRAEMPADREEVEAALEEGVLLAELTLPFRLDPGRIVSRVMKLGDFDDSGRRSPVPTDRTETFDCDLVIEAIGEEPDRKLLEGLGIRLTDRGRPSFDAKTLETNVKSVYIAGDAARGPASIIQAIADGRIAANAILRSIKVEPVVPKGSVSLVTIQKKAARPADRGRIIHSIPIKANEKEAKRAVSAEQVMREAERCLSCDAACLRCVEVCPNRANIAIPVTHGKSFTQSLQILHLDDLCNDCGACGFLCPYETKARPFKDKPTLFSSEKSFAESTNPGFFISGAGDGSKGGNKRGPEVLLRVRGETLRVSAATADPVGNAASAAGMTMEEVGDFRRMYDLANTVGSSHSYLVENKSE
ncbi:MAG TPA: FAD-dependent oxidoreductase, partial [Spirochaetia bacterium]|nr:FAD-dependent oxidoreductase [Spirochaetia bacterium]